VKILLVHNQYQRPGGEDVVVNQERRLLENRGHQVIMYERSNWEIDGYSPVKQLTLMPKTIWSTDSRRDFMRVLRREKPDLVHIHNTFVVISPSIFSACSEAGIPVVHTLHNYRLLCPAATFFRDGRICEECVNQSLLRSIQHACYRGSRPATATVALMIGVHRTLQTWDKDVSCLIALTEFARQKFVDHGFVPHKLFVKPNFVDPDPKPGTGSRDYVLFAGRLTPEKRINTVLLAFKLLADRIPLMVVGGGPEQVQLEKEAQDYGLSNVTFRGQLSREDTVDAMHHARFQIFSSEWYETFGLVIAESFACGNPVICSRLGAMKEIVDDGRTGLHFTPGDPGDLADKVTSLWNNRSLARELGEQARLEYEAKYTADKNYPMLMNIYERAMQIPKLRHDA
jgi:glycosyltransferase involved in cell wall biosynthesis